MAYYPNSKIPPTKGGGMAATQVSPYGKNPSYLGGPGTVPQDGGMTAAPYAMLNQAMTSGKLRPDKPPMGYGSMKPDGRVGIPEQQQGPVINIDPRNQAIQGPRDPGAYARMFRGAGRGRPGSGGGQPSEINWSKKDYGPWSGPGNYYHPVTGQLLGQGRENRYDWENDPDNARGGMGGNTSAFSLLSALNQARMK